jgi:hypothetical protein
MLTEAVITETIVSLRKFSIIQRLLRNLAFGQIADFGTVAASMAWFATTAKDQLTEL